MFIKKLIYPGIIISFVLIFMLCFTNKNFSQASIVSFWNINENERSIPSELAVGTKRGCSLDTTSDFMISGKQAAKFQVTNNNIDPTHPPNFIFNPPFSNWEDYQSLKFNLIALPSSLAAQSRILVQLRSLSNENQVSNLGTDIPVGTPVTVTIPLNQVKFKQEIGKILFGVCKTPGIYLIDQMELSYENVDKITVQPFALPQNVSIPEDYTVTIQQQNGFWQENTFCYNSSNPLFLDIRLIKPAEKIEKKNIQIFADQEQKLGENEITFNKGEISKKILFTPKGNMDLNVSVDNVQKSTTIRDTNGIIEENLKIREKRKQTGNRFHRGIISAYSGLIYDRASNTIDVDTTIARLKELGVNCYTYLIVRHSEAELAALPEFCEKAAKAGIEVWVYLAPPSEVPQGRNKPISERKYPPYDLDYEKWAETIAKISLKHPNLTLWMIDDFDSNRNFFSVEYTKTFYRLSKQINPKLLFGICVYHYNLKNFVKAGYLPYFDAILWGYQSSAPIYPDCGITAKSLPLEINDYYKICPNKILIPCIYFTAHSSWPKDRPSQEYLEDALKIAFEQAGIAWIFTMPAPNTWKYDLIRNYSHSVNLKK